MFTRMEKRFSIDSTLRTVYVDFIREYLNLDHMRPSSLSHSNGQRDFFLPHHGVVRVKAAQQLSSEWYLTDPNELTWEFHSIIA